MQTSCPECRTAFRVSQDQLGLRRGLVRCGKCNAVFNAYDTLLAELEEPPAATLFSGEPARDALAAAIPGLAQPEGTATLADHVETATTTAAALGLAVEAMATNAEADAVEAVHRARGRHRCG